MSDREKLIELMEFAERESFRMCDGRSSCTGCEYREYANCRETYCVDHLISNGVTVQKWIPVSERLPTKEDAKVIRGYIIAIALNGEANIWRWTEVAKHPEWFTHWMPLPEPPKECE